MSIVTVSLAIMRQNASRFNENRINKLSGPARPMTIRSMRDNLVSRCFSSLRASRRGARWLDGISPSGRRGTAALEFAVASPMLMILLGGAADFGLAQYDRAMLANAVSAGAQYAFLIGNGVPAASVGTVVTQANITSVIQSVSALPNASTTVNVSYSPTSSGVPSPGWYCITGSLPTVSNSTPGGTCSDGSAAGYYVSFVATYTTNGIMHGFMSAVSQTMSEQATVKVQ
jgi:Flp pilus assembly protein TadG